MQITIMGQLEIFKHEKLYVSAKMDIDFSNYQMNCTFEPVLKEPTAW